MILGDFKSNSNQEAYLSKSKNKRNESPKRATASHDSYEKIVRRLDCRPVLAIIFMFFGLKIGDQHTVHADALGFLFVMISMWLAVTVRGNLGMSSFTKQHFQDDIAPTSKVEHSNREKIGGSYCPMCDSFGCKCSGC